MVGWVASTAQAKPVVTTETNYYLVDGKNARAIRRDMNNKRTGKYDALTSWWVKWHFYWNTEAGLCKLTRVNTDVEIKFTLPKLMPESVANEEAKQRWDSYYPALIAHENGHRDIAIEAAAEIETALLDMEAHDNCKRLEKDANQLAHRIIDDYSARQKQYDMDNNHGMDDGAVFP
jgi:predicted secreted Zn-dependent protease